MAATAFATELDVADFMHSILGASGLGDQLGFDPIKGDYNEAVDEALLAVGEGTVSAVSSTQGLRQLRATARVELWRMVMGRTAGKHQRGLGDTARSEQQIFAHAKEMYALALQDARRLGVSSYRVGEAAHGSVKIDYAEGYHRGVT